MGIGIVLLVCFIVVMLLWGLSLVAPLPDQFAKASSWLAFLACLILGLMVFLYGSGVIVIERPAPMAR